MWAEMDPDGIAGDAWDRAKQYRYEVSPSHIRSALYPAARYREYYDVPVEKAVFQAAREGAGWRPDWMDPDESWVPYEDYRLLFDVRAGYGVSLLNERRLFEYLDAEWSRCTDASDALVLLHESLRGVGCLALSSDMDFVPDRLTMPASYDPDAGGLPAPTEELPADLQKVAWGAVFDVDLDRSYAVHQRASLLADRATERATQTGESEADALGAVCRAYTSAQRSAVAFEESVQVPLEEDDTEVIAERLHETWDDDVTAMEWLGRLSALTFEYWIDEHGEAIEQGAERY